MTFSNFHFLNLLNLNKTSVRSTLVTSFGLKRNEYSSAFSNVITLDDLFR